MEYRDLMQRYWQAKTSAAEEQVLREQLLKNDSPTPEERAARAMMAYSASPKPSVNIKLHQPRPQLWQIAVATALCSMVIFGVVKFFQPTVYGYYNGEPITTLAEAQYHADRVFANLAHAELPTDEELINKLFMLE